MQQISKAEKINARNLVTRALEAGKIVRPGACEACGRKDSPGRDGRTRIQAHHPDYSKPLEIEWLCPQCHQRQHGHPRLSAVNATEARELRRAGHSFREIGEKYGVSAPRVHQILNRPS